MKKQVWHSLFRRGFFLAACLGVHTLMADDTFRVITSPDDLRDMLQEAQWLLLPQEFPIEMDAGKVFFLPDSLTSENFLSAFTVDAEGEQPVFVFEDPETRETVFMDSEGNRVEAIAPASDYTPLWTLDVLAPGELPEGALPEDYDPARVSLAVTLLPVFPRVSEVEVATSVSLQDRRAVLKNRILLRMNKGAAASEKTAIANSFSSSTLNTGNTMLLMNAQQNSGAGVSIIYSYDADDRLIDTAIGATGAGVTETLTPAGNPTHQDERSAQ